MSAAQSVSSAISAHNQANQTEADNKKYQEDTDRAAINSQRLNEAADLHRQSEELLSTATQKGDVNRTAQMDLSTERVSAAQAGVGGNSVDAVLADTQIAASRENTRLDVNSEMTQDQLQQQKAATSVDALNQINGVRPVRVNKPSLLTPIFSIGGAALSTYDYAQNRDARAGASNPSGITPAAQQAGWHT